MTNRSVTPLGCLLALTLAGCDDLGQILMVPPGACQVAPTGGEGCAPGPTGGGGGTSPGTTGGAGRTWRLELADTSVNWDGVSAQDQWTLDPAGGTASWHFVSEEIGYDARMDYSWTAPPARIMEYGLTFDYEVGFSQVKANQLYAELKPGFTNLEVTPAEPLPAGKWYGPPESQEVAKRTADVKPVRGQGAGAAATISVALRLGPTITYSYRY